MKTHAVLLPDETATLAFGADLAVVCQESCKIYLNGDLGTGKTTFCRGFLRALGYSGNVKSPTYTLIESYILPNRIVYHFDCYRMTDPKELEYIGVRDYFDNTALCLVEWPLLGTSILPVADIILTFAYKNDSRQAQAQALSTTGEYILNSYGRGKEPPSS